MSTSENKRPTQGENTSKQKELLVQGLAVNTGNKALDDRANSGTYTKKISPFRKFLFFFTGDSQGITHYSDPISAYQARPKMWIVNLVAFLVFIALLVYMCIHSRIGDAFDKPINWEQVGEHVHDFFTPDWSYFWGYGSWEYTEGVIHNLFTTLGLTIVGTLIGFILAIPFGLFASHRLFGHWAYISEIILIIIRTFPELLLALFFVNLSGLTWVTAILCLSIHSIGMVGKLFSDQLDESDLLGLEAMDAQGANKMQRIHLAVAPEVTPAFLSVGLYRLDINLRTATTIGLVLNDSAGIGYSILLDLSKNNYHNLGADTFGIIILIVIVDLFSSWLRKKLV